MNGRLIASCVCCAPCLFAAAAPAPTLAQATDAPAAVLIAPQAADSVPAEETFSTAVPVLLDGWSCGADIVENAALLLTELARLERLIESEIATLARLPETTGFGELSERDERREAVRQALGQVGKLATPPLAALDEDMIKALAEAPPDFDLKHYALDTESFGLAGIDDGGTTKVFALRGCLQTVAADALGFRLQQAAQRVLDLSARRDAVRDAVIAGRTS